MLKNQRGFIPIPILIALAVSALIGGILGFQLGDGTFFSMGFGLGAALILFGIIYRYAKPLLHDIIPAKKNER